jgi:hypothetical protein
LLRTTLTKQRLELAERDGGFVLALPKADEIGSNPFDVDDLASANDIASVGQLIETFVAPTTWKSGGGSGTIEVEGNKLRITNTLEVRRQVLVFCERLRVARGLAVRSRYPKGLVSATPAFQLLAPKLDARTTFTFLPWSRFADVVRHWQETTGRDFLVDWSALKDLEIGPDSTIACSARDRSYSDALDGILEPLGLTWWAANGDTIQITTIEAAKNIERVEFYEVPQNPRTQFANSDAMSEALLKEIGARRRDKRQLAPSARLQVDEPSGRLIVLADAETHRFLSARLSSTE